MIFGQPYLGWWCNLCGCYHNTTACPNPQQWIIPMPQSVADGHCGKCGAPFTMDSVSNGLGLPKFTPTCACWNLPSGDADR